MLEHAWEQLKVALWNAVWAVNLARLPPARSAAVRYLRLAHMVAREIADGQLSVRAASLVYTTLLSLVPVLAVSFSILKAFDVHYELTPLLLGALEPLGEKGIDLGYRILEFVDNVQVGKLGSLGVALLLFAVISLLHKVEKAFNYAWRVERARRLGERFSSYLTVVLVGPVLVFTALGVTASVTRHALYREALSIGAIGYAAALGGRLLPYLLVIAAFTFAYLYMPNTRVRMRSALVGGIVAGILWASAGWGFATLVVTSSKYTAIYSSFAIVVLFMMWIYIGWLVLLLGASVAFYHQHPEYLGLLTHELDLSARLRERLALATCYLVAERHRQGGDPWSAAALAQHLGVPLAPLERLLDVLHGNRLLAVAAGEVPAYLPGRDPATTPLAEIVAAARRAGETRQTGLERIEEQAGPPAAVAARIEAAIEGTLAERSLADLVDEGQATLQEVTAGADNASGEPAVVREFGSR